MKTTIFSLILTVGFLANAVPPSVRMEEAKKKPGYALAEKRFNAANRASQLLSQVELARRIGSQSAKDSTNAAQASADLFRSISRAQDLAKKENEACLNLGILKALSPKDADVEVAANYCVFDDYGQSKGSIVNSIEYLEGTLNETARILGLFE